MIDIRFLRDNAEQVKTAVKNKNEKVDIDAILALDEQRRKLQFQFDTLKAGQNKVSALIARKKKSGEDAAGLIAEMGKVAQQIKEISEELSDTGDKLDMVMLSIPNLPHPEVTVGTSEASNRFIREWGTKQAFDFSPVDHLVLAEKNALLDLQRGAKVSGSGFPVYTGLGAAIERALINFMLQYHIQKHGYTEIWAPFIVNRKAMIGTGQLPKLENDMYHVEEDDLWLIPTAEVPITHLHAEEIMSHKSLPVKYVGFTPCFRREAGSYGKDTRGLQRIHQFNKVEIVRFVTPETSYDALEEMVTDAEHILQALGLHYRVIELCTGDMSFASAKTYDIEVWAAGLQKYLEVSSVSNFEDFQARRANIRYRDDDGKLRFIHTLNGSGVATPRLMIALLEQYQQADGSIKVPPIIQNWLNYRI